MLTVIEIAAFLAMTAAFLAMTAAFLAMTAAFLAMTERSVAWQSVEVHGIFNRLPRRASSQ